MHIILRYFSSMQEHCADTDSSAYGYSCKNLKLNSVGDFIALLLAFRYYYCTRQIQFNINFSPDTLANKGISIKILKMYRVYTKGTIRRLFRNLDSINSKCIKRVSSVFVQQPKFV
jgi:hypothetical protein